VTDLRAGTRKVLVTGGGTGIGRAVAEHLLRLGASVAVCGRRPEPLESLAAAFPGRAVPLIGDVTDPTFQGQVCERARNALGGLDGVVYSAGAVTHEPLGAISETALRGQLEVNLVGALRIAEKALDALEDGGGIVFVSSTLAHRPIPTSAVYSAAKAGMLAAMKTVALTGAARGIRANAVLPGIVETDMVRERLATEREGMRRLHPLGRLGNPEDVAEAVVHLLGAPWTTGAELNVDGGLLLRE
jgi:NAD(P)-dependent dehydrogenase (short-subunit alcohol dehydrogenase family)